MLLRISALTISMFASPSIADGLHDGQLVDVAARRVFAPTGFDDNDEATVVVDGYLPSGCYRLTRPEAYVDSRAKTITILPKARFFDVPCIEMLVPYHFEVALGHLSIGQYEVSVGPTSGVTETLPIAEAASAGPDEHLYAPIDEASIDLNPVTGKVEATIAGRLTSMCLVWDQIQVADHGATIDLLPILKVAAGVPCNDFEQTFKRRVELPDSISAGRHLLNVRSLNGRAINVLFTKNLN